MYSDNKCTSGYRKGLKKTPIHFSEDVKLKKVDLFC